MALPLLVPTALISTQQILRQEKGKLGAPLVNEFGIVTFDTRHLKS
jgi:hypothetical protein